MREIADRARIERFMEAFARSASENVDVFLVGGATAVLLGWRESTMDIDLAMAPERDEMLRAIPALKDRLQVNVELASPDQFVPVPSGWQARSPLVSRVGRVTYRHFDLHAQALAKIERGHARDVADVAAMLSRGLIEPAELRRVFALMKPELYRFPAIDPPTFARAVADIVGS